jgi:glycosyltransferase involved in cell wall biosynthesis
MAAIIVPAHNEESVIATAIDSILSEVKSDDEIIIACNGCSDDTVIIARRYEPRVVVIENTLPSKIAALNSGDFVAVSFPRIYMDADVRLSPGALTKIKERLCEGTVLAVSPNVTMDFTGASWSVRAYYKIWLDLPYIKKGMVGAGVYALSREGRERFGDFPNVIADDGYVRALFNEHERCMVQDAFSIVRAPATLDWLIKIKTRSRLGNIELMNALGVRPQNNTSGYFFALRGILLRPKSWAAFGVYLYVTLITRIHANRKYGYLSSYVWERDKSTRKNNVDY